ncbi:hypothetical protein CANCADRAFT_30966 [Tortispora caseinolytica NRRL Y-17796]|uniref:TATA-binding protein-associated factor MOT1 n=1 Tax=Tortispora caseinolytica NRRL Y-17796 TaxID=767744 RepID=A0A1E4TMJ7_9ASCO|nr:hypothetical protein CANCADRAFT_30966 [Tortispora caseinolytica NRRL Y-17796]
MTRLDRLVLLLDTSASAQVRQTAITQLGEIQKDHPEELFNLISRVLPYLQSKKWDTRTAAVRALGAVLENCPAWDPNQVDSEPAKSELGNDEPDPFVKVKPEEHIKAEDGAQDNSTKPDLPRPSSSLLTFQEIDLHSILSKGKILLGSGGSEYDIMTYDKSTDQIMRQKRIIEKSLGLADYADQSADDFVNDADLDFASRPGSPAPSSNSRGTKRKASEAELHASDQSPSVPSPSEPPAPVTAENSGTSTPVSARLKAMAKRRSKLTSKNPKQHASAPASSAVSSTQNNDLKSAGSDNSSPDSENKVVIENTKHAALISAELKPDDADMWPFERICSRLLVDIFNEQWEVRHGALGALREIIRLHGASAGMRSGLSIEENSIKNASWLEDVASRLCCVLALDRFGDYVSDQVVAPIRESAGQTLGVVLMHFESSKIGELFRLLYQLVNQSTLGLHRTVWEASHGGLLGMKYLVSVRPDILINDQVLFNSTIESVIRGLKEVDDDVRSVSAAILIPVADEVVSRRCEIIPQILDMLWECIEQVSDDLSASTGTIIDLLGKLYSSSAVVDYLRTNADCRSSSLSKLVPTIFPFLRHLLSDVRVSTLKTLNILVSVKELSQETTIWLDDRAFRLVFQCFLTERSRSILDLALELWNSYLLFYSDNKKSLSGILSPHVPAFVRLLMTPIGTGRLLYPTDTSLLLLEGTAHKTRGPGRSDNGSELHGLAVDTAMLAGDVSLIGEETFFYSKVYCAKALGRLFYILDLLDDENVRQTMLSVFDGPYSSSRMAVALAIEEACSYSVPSQETCDSLISHFQAQFSLDVIYFEDISPLLRSLRSNILSICTLLTDAGHLNRSKLPPIPALVQGEPAAGAMAFSFDTAETFVNKDLPSLKKMLSTSRRVEIAQSLMDATSDLQNMLTQTKNEYLHRKNLVLAILASCIIYMDKLLPKMNNLIRCLMDSVKSEVNVELQRRSCHAIVKLIRLCNEKGKKGISDKLVKNLCSFLCMDSFDVPEFQGFESLHDTIYSLHRIEAGNQISDASQSDIQNATRTTTLGAKYTLECLIKSSGDTILTDVPKLNEIVFEPPKIFNEPDFDEKLAQSPELAQSTLDAVSICRLLLPYFVPTLSKSLSAEVLPVLKGIESSFSVVRSVCGRCFASYCNVNKALGMQYMISHVLPLVEDVTSIRRRQGAIECIYHAVQELDISIVPYIAFFIVPVMGRMSDSNSEIRLIASTTFASLIRLSPLESDSLPPEGISEELANFRAEQRAFLKQMLDPHKIEPFKLPVAIRATLRPYQQDGLNWLMFLNRYRLHGILCDDMGLGKTLQAVCAVASDHHIRSEKYRETQEESFRRLPSLVICPSTLIGHWVHEFGNFAPFMNVIGYGGSTGARVRLRPTLFNADVIVTSYDIARNDLAFFNESDYNYCVLDEGHVIKNPAAKLTLAVKQIRAEHRLILSGTPIQNNVLELWSLFDFLMPGFLGTEKQFNERIAKPIAASRSAKGSNKDSEAGPKALDSLHKQVLPFLLRRMKEDVLDDLPPKIIQDHYCELSDLQRELYDDLVKSQRTSVTNDLQKGGKEKTRHVFEILQLLRRLCDHPALLVTPKHPRFAEINKSLKGSGHSIRDISVAPKLTALKELLLDCGIGVDSSDLNTGSTGVISQHRALVFFQLKDMLDICENELLKKHMPGVSYLRMDGTVDSTKRFDIVQTFNADPSIDILLLTTKVGGVGLNLTSADTVIFVEHDWNPMNDLQAMDRVHRIGQKKVVNVYRLITRNTIEEKIMGLQKFKLNIASSVINQQNSGLESMGTDQLLDLFNDTPRDSIPSSDKIKPVADSEEETANIPGVQQPFADGSSIWEENDYSDEYSLNNYLHSLKTSKT